MMRSSMYVPRAALVGMLMLLAVAPAAFAQQSPGNPPRPQIPNPQDIDPAVDTSAPAQTASPAASDAPAAATAPTRGPDAPAPPAAGPSAVQPAVPQTAPATEAPAARGPAAAGPANRGGVNRIELDATQITGNRELPRVLYIVPWKRSDLGELLGRPVNSLLDEVLAPVDRDVFQRENRYYQALRPDEAPAASQPRATAPPGGEDER
jgi:hypothetical protein